MHLYNLHQAYQILELEDPITYQQRVLNFYLEQAHNNDGFFDSEIVFRERFLFLRQTGRTTFKCVDAALRILRGKDVMFFTHNMRSSKRCKEIIENYIQRLNYDNQIQSSDLGRLEVKSANNINHIKTATVSWGGEIIVDIY